MNTLENWDQIENWKLRQNWDWDCYWCLVFGKWNHRQWKYNATVDRLSLNKRTCVHKLLIFYNETDRVENGKIVLVF